MKLAEFATAHPLMASIGFLAAEAVPLLTFAGPEQVHVAAVLAVGLALMVAQKLLLQSFIASVIATGASFDDARRGFEGRVASLEEWKKGMDCPGPAVCQENVERLEKDLREVRELPAIAAALRQKPHLGG